MNKVTTLFLLMMFFMPVVQAQDWTNEEIVNAIYIAEGGKKAQFPYGIRSIKCSGEAECRQICLNTVRNNRRRFTKQTEYKDFISFLGSRYCPTKGNLSPAERKLNGNWVPNVRRLLEKGRNA